MSKREDLRMRKWPTTDADKRFASTLNRLEYYGLLEEALVPMTVIFWCSDLEWVLTRMKKLTAEGRVVRAWDTGNSRYIYPSKVGT